MKVLFTYTHALIYARAFLGQIDMYISEHPPPIPLSLAFRQLIRRPPSAARLVRLKKLPLPSSCVQCECERTNKGFFPTIDR